MKSGKNLKLIKIMIKEERWKVLEKVWPVFLSRNLIKKDSKPISFVALTSEELAEYTTRQKLSFVPAAMDLLLHGYVAPDFNVLW